MSDVLDKEVIKPDNNMSDEDLDREFNAQFEGFDDEVEEYDDEDIDDEEEPKELEAEEQEKEPEKTEQEQLQDAFLEIEYLKEKKNLTKEEAKTLAQKGMNYDRMLEKMKALEENPLLDFANSLMREYGFEDPNEFLSAINKQKEKETFETEVKNYIAQGIGKELAEKLARADAREAEDEKVKAIKQEEEATTKAYMELFNWHREKFGSELDVSKMSDETLQAISNGVSPLFAYKAQLYENGLQSAELEAQQKLMKQHEKSKSAPPSTNDDPQDDQIHEFTAKYIEEMVKVHGRKWIAKNYEAIEKSGYFNQ